MAYDIGLALMCGIDIPIPECQIVLHQPTIREIALIGDADFFTAIQTLCVSKNMLAQGETRLTDTNNFQIFMMIMQEKEAKDKKDAVTQFFPLIFPKHRAILTPRSIILSGEGESIIIDESNFDAFQNILRQVFCINTGPMEMQSFNPSNQKAKEIADKLMRARQRVAAQKREESGSIFIQYVSVLTVGLQSMSFQNCINLTMYQLFDLIERYSLYINWDLDIRSRLAGAKADKQPENWMKKIH